MRIGVIGLGKMGAPIALKLLEAGHEVTVWNRSREAAGMMIEAGATAVFDPADALQGDLALTMLFDDESIRTVLLDSGRLANASPTCVHACMSTISMELARELVDVHARLRLPYVAAPVLGRPDTIERQGLNILAAGDPVLLDYLEAPLRDLGNMWRVGFYPPQAHVAKLAANFMIGSAAESMAEAATLVGAYGADPKTFLSIMTESLFSAPVYWNCAATITGERSSIPPCDVAVPLKDTGLTLAAAEKAGIAMPFAQTVREKTERRAAADAYADMAAAFVQRLHAISR